MTEEVAIAHTHQHGRHVHTHEHPAGDQIHVHGWHTPEEVCTGDDTFGREANYDEQMAVPLPSPVLQVGTGPPRPYRIILPHVKGMLKPGVQEAVAAQAHLYYLADVSVSQYHYWRLFADLWADCYPFVLVEHDIVIPDGCLDGFEECAEPWCVHDYEVFMGGIENKYGKAGAFGLVRFRSSIMADNPTLVTDLFDKHWSHLDGLVAAALRARGPGDGTRYDSHRHHPDAVHLHDYSHIPQAAREATAELHGVPHILNGYDWDGVLSPYQRVTPEQPFVIISGRTLGEGRPVMALAEGIYMRATGAVGDREAAGAFKAEKINELGVTRFYEDDPRQAEIIRGRCHCEVIVVGST